MATLPVEEAIDNDSPALGSLRVFPPDSDPVEYPIAQGEVTLGRGEDCELTLTAGSLSRKHAKILVEEGSHFVMDLDSRNGTFRRTMKLKPNIYYELTNGVDLVFANLNCTYVIHNEDEVGVADNEGGRADEEETQAYGLEEPAKETEELSDDNTVCDSGEGVASEKGGGGDEATQAYELNASLESMEVDPTVAYDLHESGNEGDKEGEEDDDADSVASSPLLVGGAKPPDDIEGSPSRENQALPETTPPDDGATPSDNETTQDDTETQEDEVAPTGLTRGLTVVMSTAPLDYSYTENTNTEPVTSKETDKEVDSPDKESNKEDPGSNEEGDASKDSDATDVEDEESSSEKPVGDTTDKTGQLKQQPSTLFGPSLMDYCNQGTLPSYEESCDLPEEGGGGTALTRGTTVVMESVYPSLGEAPSQEEVPVVSKETSGGDNNEAGLLDEDKNDKAKDNDNDDNDGGTSEQVIPKTEGSTQRTFSLSSTSGRGKRGRAKTRGRGRKKNEQPDLPQLPTEDTEALLNYGHKDSSFSKPHPLDDKPHLPDDKPHPLEPTMNPTLSLMSMEVDYGTLPATLKLEPTILEENNTDSAPAKVPKVKRGASSKRGRGGRKQTTTRKKSKDSFELEESPDLEIGASPKTDQSDEKLLDDQSDCTSELSSKGSTASESGWGKKGRSKAKPPSKPKKEVSRTSSRRLASSNVGTATECPRVMFTGLTDDNCERIISELGGELVDSVYQCTHLVTDKVRRTVKFLCCLSRGCLIVSSDWLMESERAGHFLSAEPFLIKDRASERQFNFSLVKSYRSAQLCKVLDGYTVYLTANIKPQREQMADIIRCAGGDPLEYDPSSVTSGDKVVVVTCEEDVSRTCDGVSGVPVCSTELILGGVLKQEMNIDSHRMSDGAPATGSIGRKRKASSTTSATVKRKRK